MLALQLHKARQPNLNTGAYFVPIMRWREDAWRDRGAESNWVRQLELLDREFGASPRGSTPATVPWPRVGEFWRDFEFRGHARAYLNWKRVLEVKSGRSYYRNTLIRFISLVRIPDSHPVFLARDWVDKGGGITGCALRDVPVDLKSIVNSCSDLPELVIVRRLPPRYCLWTKDLRLLQRGDTREGGTRRVRGGRLRGSWGSGAA